MFMTLRHASKPLLTMHSCAYWGLPSNLGKSRQAGSGKATNPGNLPQIRVIYYEIWVTTLRRVRFPGNLWRVLVIRMMVLKFQNLWRRLRAFLFWRWFNTGPQMGSIRPWRKLHQDHQAYIWPTNIYQSFKCTAWESWDKRFEGELILSSHYSVWKCHLLVNVLCINQCCLPGCVFDHWIHMIVHYKSSLVCKHKYCLLNW